VGTEERLQSYISFPCKELHLAHEMHFQDVVKARSDS
jgi:hypothetical protein